MTRRTRIVGLIGAMVLGFGLVSVSIGATGQLDPSFGQRGLAITATAPADGADIQNGLAVRADRSIVVAGSSDMGPGAGGQQFRVSQYTKRGQLDAGFGKGGTVLTPVSSQGGFDEHILDIALGPDGRIVAAGVARSAAGGGGDNFALARYNANGSLDASFGSSGIVITAVAQDDFRDNADAVAIQSDGKIVAAGAARNGCAAAACGDFAIARYNANGTLDSSFGGGDGIVTTAVASGLRFDSITDVALQPDGKIVAIGQANMGPAGGLNFAFARYNVDGSLDATFGSGGIVTTSVAPGNGADLAWQLALQTDGKIVGVGNANMGVFDFDVAVTRYNPDGSLDASFGGDGVVTVPLGAPGSFDNAWSVAIDAARRIVIGGETASGSDLPDFVLARFLGDGNVDATFGDGGIIVTPTARDGGYDVIFEVAIDKTGKIVASGECDQPGTGSDVCVARYQAGDD